MPVRDASADHGRQAMAALLAQLREQANAALAACERWFDGDADAAATLDSTLAQLEQVATLARLDGIALLARENRVLAPTAGGADEAVRRQAVAEGLVALGTHLAAVQPGIVAPIGRVVEDIDRLRAARDEPPLDREAMFVEILRAQGPYTPPHTPPPAGGPTQQAVAQRALDAARKIAAALGKAPDPKPALAAVRKLAQSLERVSADPEGAAPWWVARSLADATDAGTVALPQARALLAEVGIQVERVAGGTRAADEWTYRMLFALRGSAGEELERVYGLSRIVAELEPPVSARRTADAGSAREAVAAAASEEIARVRDAYDVFLRSGAADTNLLKPAVARLDAVVPTLHVADLGGAAELLADVRTALAALVAGQPLGNAAHAIADQMLRAEEVLATSGGDGPGEKLREEAIHALVDASLGVLANIRQAVFEASEVGDESALAELPRTMADFAGALKVSGLEDAAALVVDAAETIRAATAGDAPHEALAEAFVCLELYLATRRDRPEASAELLARAQGVLADALPEGVRGARQDGEAEPPVVDGEPDPDLLDIYVAEAREVTEEAHARHAEWVAAPEATEPRGELQRLFHTLKGSGRMVGALRIAEFAKCFEDLLGRLPDGPPSAAVIELTGAGVAVLPALVEQVESGADPGLDLRALKRAADQPDPTTIAPGTSAPILAALAIHHLDTVHRWLDALAEGKASGQAPVAVTGALAALERAATPLGAAAVQVRAADLRAKLDSAPEVDEALRREAVNALDAIHATISPAVGERVDAVSADAYREEAHGLLDRMSEACDALLLDAADADAVLTMQRVLHTLKGASRVAGFRALSDIAHSLEAVLRAIAQERMIVTPRVLWTLQRVFDAMYGMLEPDTAATAGERAARIIEELAQAGADRSLPPLSSGADRRRKPRVAAESERVRSDQFDRALVRALSLGLRSAELDHRMHEQTMWNIATIGGMLRELADDAAAIRDLLVRARVAPVHTHAPRWRRTVRQAAEDTGREVELRFEGSDTEVDRRLLDALVTPFEHLLRNAVAHGIESPFARRAAGKPAGGVITIRTTFDRDGLVIEVDDDGAGIDAEKVRRAARERGLAVPDGTLDSRKLLEVIATPGFTTAPNVTHAAGYGMGVDTVCAAIRELGGRVELDTRVGKGTRFILHLPNPSPVLSVALVRTGSALVAVPWQAVTATRAFEAGATAVEHDGERWPLVSLAGPLAMDSARPSREAATAVLVRSNQRGIAIVADENLGRTEVAMHRLRPGDMKAGACVAGVGLLDGGRLSSVLNVEALIAAAPEALNIRPFAFVADDSPTARDEVVRKLERLGWRVMAVEDGSQARQHLLQQHPQLIVLDVDMPGYDGLTIVEWLRAERKHVETPVVLVSAEFTDQRRQRADDLGVRACVAKPFSGVEFEDVVVPLSPQA